MSEVTAEGSMLQDAAMYELKPGVTYTLTESIELDGLSDEAGEPEKLIRHLRHQYTDTGYLLAQMIQIQQTQTYALVSIADSLTRIAIQLGDSAGA